tara:strand:+ start:321 stop:794 length:474 start_codon:yes stop_codon:yes gene_type:complete
MNTQKIILFIAIINLFFYEIFLLKKTKDKTEKMFLIAIVLVQIIYLLTCFSGNFIKNKILITIEEIIHFLFFLFLISTIFFKCKKNIIKLSIIICLLTLLSRLFFYDKKKGSGCLFSLSINKKGEWMKLWDNVVPNLNYDYIYSSLLIINIYYYYTC